ncbi:phytanoyl-CoA dioxygenase family protein [Pseudarthrobacter sp. SSS035]|uniref:phytanoyl-CoA dioxygenase family protein n=1 Tax=Pseudarthrobacter sp. SSS035 TaxID=2931399 RepID=UPI00200D4EEC|nr:phytanoyl-CoA dioxygenase family protein [Pseudarthrobacter sp. SSS035]
MTVTTGPNTRDHYDREGYVTFPDVLDQDLIAEADSHVDWLLDKHPDLRPEQLGHKLSRNDPFWLRLVSDNRLLDIAEQFIGPDIALFATHYICKPPRTGQAVQWHQDGAFWPLEPMNVVSLWLAVSESDSGNGCLRVIPKSHHRELSGMKESDDTNSVLRSQIIDAQLDDAQPVDLILQPGGVSVHHPNSVHGSNANTSDRWRRGLTIRYIPTSTRIMKPEAASPFLLRGRPVDGVNEYLALPRFNDGEHMPFRGSDDWR